MSTGEVTELHEGWRYKTLNGAGVGIADAGPHNICPVCVPYPHILRRAELWTRDQTNSDTDGLVLSFLEDADGSAAIVDNTQTWEDSSNKSTRTAFKIAELERPAGIYYVTVTADAGDAMLNPVLSLMVSPVPPGPA